LRASNSDEVIELTIFPPSGPVKVQEDLVHPVFDDESIDKTIASFDVENTGSPMARPQPLPAAA
jgi:lactoylglutathione lyase